jgi:sugar/nucleoside kinase (ribokinase family)
MTPAGFSPSTSPIAIVGNVNLDFRTGPIPAGPAVLRDGETSVAEIYETLGGGAANTAAAAAALGGRVQLCACVGDDALGRRLEEHLRKIGVVTRLIRKPEPTGRSIALNWDNHQRHFLSCLPSSLQLSAEDVDLAGMREAGCRHLYRADVWFAPRMLAGGNLRLLREAQAMGMETSLDINWDPAWGVSDAGPIAARLVSVADVLPHVTFAHGNERELCQFTGADHALGAVKWILDRGTRTVVLHRGPGGCAAFTDQGEVIDVAARPVTHVACEAGTGDVFTAAFLLLPDVPLTERLKLCAEIAARHLEGSLNLLPRIG